MVDERIRVAHVITRMIVGGAQETVLLAAALADCSRFEPVVVCGPQTGSEGSLHDEVRRRGVELVVVPELVREVNPIADARVVPALTRLFRDCSFDVVHTNSSKAGIVGRLAARRAALPAIHTVHGWPFHDQQRRAGSLLWTLLERRAAPLARQLVVVADTDREKGLSAGIGVAEQYRTIRSGLELELYAPDPDVRGEVRRELGFPDNAVVLGAVNRLSPQKDPLTLVRAAAIVLQKRSDARLLLVGDGPLRFDVEREIAALGISSQVILTGLRPDVPQLLQAMDLFVLASQWEGLPRTIVQATASGLPVVATDADGVRDVIVDGSTGRLVPARDVGALAAAVSQLVEHPGLGRAMAEAARQRLPEFDAVMMVRTLERLYVEAAA